MGYVTRYSTTRKLSILGFASEAETCIADGQKEKSPVPKRPDYGDATPEDLALALMRFQRAPLKKKQPEKAKQDRRKPDERKKSE